MQLWDTTPEPLESVTATHGAGTCNIADEQPQQLSCSRVEHNFLRTLRVSVAVGRDFALEDDLRGAPRVALISHGLWVRRFGSDPGVIGRTLNLESATERVQRVRIIGVLPAYFEMPLEAADIPLPFQLRPLDPDRTFNLHITTLHA